MDLAMNEIGPQNLDLILAPLAGTRGAGRAGAEGQRHPELSIWVVPKRATREKAMWFHFFNSSNKGVPLLLVRCFF